MKIYTKRISLDFGIQGMKNKKMNNKKIDCLTTTNLLNLNNLIP
ncbi:hypothetical protein HMPREF9944_00129 [Segatella maculosa OT 289]|uniref:Uncharacterized protein n=1 Tax=Segatella maculosa OT 289 TaxID=999422 RepID=H1HIY5_9BACT|nr:hypothetical protein HMPREF9944_00129 [Segatella maculosa OT 289]